MYSIKNVVFTLVLASGWFGCSADDAANSDGSNLGDLADGSMLSPDMTINNPRNPVGAGPAAIDIGSAANLGSAGSYVILAKTGITNVTGSSITGGNLGLSPAAASFATGFAMVADSSNAFSTSPSVVAPAKIYAADYAN